MRKSGWMNVLMTEWYKDSYKRMDKWRITVQMMTMYQESRRQALEDGSWRGRKGNKKWEREKQWQKKEERKMKMVKWNRERLERIKCHWRRVMDRLPWSEGADSRVTKDGIFITVRVGDGERGIIDGEKCQSRVFHPLLGWMSREISNEQ